MRRCNWARVISVALIACVAAAPRAFALSESEIQTYFMVQSNLPNAQSKVWSRATDVVTYRVEGWQTEDVASALREHAQRISQATGITVRRAARYERLDMVLIVSETAIQDIRARPQKLWPMGADAALTKRLQAKYSQTDLAQKKYVGAFSVPFVRGRERFTAFTRREPSSNLVAALLAGVGVRYRPYAMQEEEALRMACILYQGRRLAIRTVEGYLKYGDVLEHLCAPAS